jgi:hypothetical protein
LWGAGAEVLEGAAAAFDARAGFLVFFTFLTFLVVAGAVAVFPPAGVEAGAWAANVKGMAATANPIAKSVFFMVLFLPCGLLLPAHNLMLRQAARKLDSLRRLIAVPNSGAPRLMFIRV